MPAPLNLTYASAVILGAIADGGTYGFQIIDQTGLPSGTVYPALRRLEAAGIIETRWDHAGAEKSGGPPRKYYSLTSAGKHHLDILRKRYPRSSEVRNLV